MAKESNKHLRAVRRTGENRMQRNLQSLLERAKVVQLWGWHLKLKVFSEITYLDPGTKLQAATQLTTNAENLSKGLWLMVDPALTAW